MEHKRAVIFDCWNTLFRNTEIDPVKEFASKTGYSADDRQFLKTLERNLMIEEQEGDELKRGIRDSLEELDVEPSNELVDDIYEMFHVATRNIEPFPGAIETLERLSEDYLLGLVTNTFYLSQKQLEEQFDINSFFDATFVSCREGMLKPDPEVFDIILGSLGVSREEAVMVGDSLEDDVRAAENFGIDGVLIDREDSAGYPDDAKQITSLEQLENYLGL